MLMIFFLFLVLTSTIYDLKEIVQFNKVFTREILSRDEIIPVYGEMSLTVYTFLPRWNFILEWTHPCQFHPGMK